LADQGAPRLPIVGILLAAGASRRFGADKLGQALPEGLTVAARACRVLRAGTDGVLAVVRPGNEDLAERLRAAGAEVLFCPQAERGMGASLAFGVRALPENAAGCLVALADMPWIEPATVRAVTEALRLGALLAAPCHRGARGHPVGFSSALRGELSKLDGEEGARSVIQAHRGELQRIDVEDAGIARDIDRPEDIAGAPPRAPA
jgi:molybdenum cofactor cytidylyltransferase